MRDRSSLRNRGQIVSFLIVAGPDITAAGVFVSFAPAVFISRPAPQKSFATDQAFITNDFLKSTPDSPFLSSDSPVPGE